MRTEEITGARDRVLEAGRILGRKTGLETTLRLWHVLAVLIRLAHMLAGYQVMRPPSADPKSSAACRRKLYQFRSGEIPLLLVFGFWEIEM